MSRVFEIDKEICGWLAVIEGPSRGEAFRIFEGRNVVGSASDCDILLPGLEPHHFSLRCTGGEVYITDYDTESGTYVNGEKILRVKLKDEDRIKAGAHVLAIKLV